MENPGPLGTFLYGKIVVIKRNGEDGSIFPLTLPKCIMGRGDQCSIRIQLPDVSEQQCIIQVDDGCTVSITNLGNDHPTTLNGSPLLLDAVPLSHKDVITIIDRQFRFEYPDNQMIVSNQIEDADLSASKNSMDNSHKAGRLTSRALTPLRKPPTPQFEDSGENKSTKSPRSKRRSSHAPLTKDDAHKCLILTPKIKPPPTGNVKGSMATPTSPGKPGKRSSTDLRRSLAELRLRSGSITETSETGVMSPKQESQLGSHRKRKSTSPASTVISSKRKRVSFGAHLSPELFDKRLPPGTPIRRGTRLSVDSLWSSPAKGLLKRKSVSTLPSTTTINEETPKSLRSRSPKVVSQSPTGNKESAVIFAAVELTKTDSPKRGSPRVQSLAAAESPVNPSDCGLPTKDQPPKRGSPQVQSPAVVKSPVNSPAGGSPKDQPLKRGSPKPALHRRSAAKETTNVTPNRGSPRTQSAGPTSLTNSASPKAQSNSSSDDSSFLDQKENKSAVRRRVSRHVVVQSPHIVHHEMSEDEMQRYVVMKRQEGATFKRLSHSPENNLSPPATPASEKFVPSAASPVLRLSKATITSGAASPIRKYSSPAVSSHNLPFLRSSPSRKQPVVLIAQSSPRGRSAKTLSQASPGTVSPTKASALPEKASSRSSPGRAGAVLTAAKFIASPRSTPTRGASKQISPFTSCTDTSAQRSSKSSPQALTARSIMTPGRKHIIHTDTPRPARHTPSELDGDIYKEPMVKIESPPMDFRKAVALRAIHGASATPALPAVTKAFARPKPLTPRPSVTPRSSKKATPKTSWADVVRAGKRRSIGKKRVGRSSIGSKAVKAMVVAKKKAKATSAIKSAAAPMIGLMSQNPRGAAASTGHAESPATIVLKKSRSIARVMEQTPPLKNASPRKSTARSPKKDAFESFDTEDIPPTPLGPGIMFVSPMTQERKRSRPSPLSTWTAASPSLVGVKELLEQPRLRKNVDLAGVKELFAVPRTRKSVGMVGVKTLLAPQKTRKSVSLVGLKNLLTVKKTRKSIALVGVKELMAASGDAKRDVDLKGVRDLFKSPKQMASPRLTGIKELMKEQRPAFSPKLSGVRQLMKTPRHVSPTLEGVSELLFMPKANTRKRSSPAKKTKKQAATELISIRRTRKTHPAIDVEYPSTDKMVHLKETSTLTSTTIKMQRKSKRTTRETTTSIEKEQLSVTLETKNTPSQCVDTPTTSLQSSKPASRRGRRAGATSNSLSQTKETTTKGEHIQLKLTKLSPNVESQNGSVFAENNNRRQRGWQATDLIPPTEVSETAFIVERKLIAKKPASRKRPLKSDIAESNSAALNNSEPERKEISSTGQRVLRKLNKLDPQVDHMTATVYTENSKRRRGRKATELLPPTMTSETPFILESEPITTKPVSRKRTLKPKSNAKTGSEDDVSAPKRSKAPRVTLTPVKSRGGRKIKTATTVESPLQRPSSKRKLAHTATPKKATTQSKGGSLQKKTPKKKSLQTTPKKLSVTRKPRHQKTISPKSNRPGTQRKLSEEMHSKPVVKETRSRRAKAK